MRLSTRLLVASSIAILGLVGSMHATATPAGPQPVAATLAIQAGAVETQMKIDPPSSAAVKKIFKVVFDGIEWYEAEDGDGNRYWIHVITWGANFRGVTFFGTPSTRHFVKFH